MCVCVCSDACVFVHIRRSIAHYSYIKSQVHVGRQERQPRQTIHTKFVNVLLLNCLLHCICVLPYYTHVYARGVFMNVLHIFRERLAQKVRKEKLEGKEYLEKMLVHGTTVPHKYYNSCVELYITVPSFVTAVP